MIRFIIFFNLTLIYCKSSIIQKRNLWRPIPEGTSGIGGWSTGEGAVPIPQDVNVDEDYSSEIKEAWAEQTKKRQEAGSGELKYSKALSLANRDHCNLMTIENKMGHFIGDSTHYSRIANYATVMEIGENIASNHGSGKGLVEQYMNSPGHKKTMLDPKFVYGGIACGRADGGFGHLRCSFMYAKDIKPKSGFENGPGDGPGVHLTKGGGGGPAPQQPQQPVDQQQPVGQQPSQGPMPQPSQPSGQQPSQGQMNFGQKGFAGPNGPHMPGNPRMPMNSHMPKFPLEEGAQISSSSFFRGVVLFLFQI